MTRTTLYFLLSSAFGLSAACGSSSGNGGGSGGDAGGSGGDASAADGSDFGDGAADASVDGALPDGAPTCSISGQTTYTLNTGNYRRGDPVSCGVQAQLDTSKTNLGRETESCTAMAAACAASVVCDVRDTSVTASAKYAFELSVRGNSVSGTATVVQSSSGGDVTCHYDLVTGRVNGQ